MVSNMDNVKDKIIDWSRSWYQEINIKIRNTRFPTLGVPPWGGSGGMGLPTVERGWSQAERGSKGSSFVMSKRCIATHLEWPILIPCDIHMFTLSGNPLDRSFSDQAGYWMFSASLQFANSLLWPIFPLQAPEGQVAMENIPKPWWLRHVTIRLQLTISLRIGIWIMREYKSNKRNFEFTYTIAVYSHLYVCVNQ